MADIPAGLVLPVLEPGQPRLWPLLGLRASWPFSSLFLKVVAEHGLEPGTALLIWLLQARPTAGEGYTVKGSECVVQTGQGLPLSVLHAAVLGSGSHCSWWRARRTGTSSQPIESASWTTSNSTELLP